MWLLSRLLKEPCSTVFARFSGYRETKRGGKAREATEAEYGTMWDQLQASYPFYDRYRERTARKIPVVILERT